MKGKGEGGKARGEEGFSLVKLVDVHKIYKLGEVEVHALRGVNLEVERGEFVAIVGPSGSGKSTLLNMIGAMDRPTKGQVFIEGQDITKMSDKERAKLRLEKIGFVFQQYHLIPWLPAIKSVEIPLMIAGVPPKERRKRAEALLHEVGLGDRMWHKPSELSGGEQQRVAIARALANEPEILLADEPTGNLDTKTGAEIVKLIRRLNEEKGVTCIIVTHDLEVAAAARRVLYLRDGRIVRGQPLAAKVGKEKALRPEEEGEGA